MSFFYLNPVTGNMPAHLLESILFKRLDFLEVLMDEGKISYNEYVIDGSIYDNIGHFTLCIAMALCDNKRIGQYYLKAEVELFKRRLSELSAYDLRIFAKRILRSLKKLDIVPKFLEPLMKLCQYLMLKNVAKHICENMHNSVCDVYRLQLPFKHCLQLIANREVELSNGIADISCGRWTQFLVILFRKNLQRKVYETNLKPLCDDIRILELVKKVNIVKGTIYSLCNNNNIVGSKDVDHLTSYFPPCMLNLHLKLRSRHRLSHEQRFYYSLFLKDIGMPVEEAIEFWKTEYQKVPNGSHVCCHHWEKDEKKYLYSIRHAYGLEGGRKNYSSVSCHKMQSNCNASSEGGCPFRSFDYENMTKILSHKFSLSQNLISDIINLKNKGQCKVACSVYLHGKFPKTDCDIHGFNAPIEYFKKAYLQ